jgi:coenzyme F420-reducing hydrogenase alpha subunit
MEWYKREQVVRAAEAKAQEAHTATEKRIAAAEKKEAEAQAALQRLDWARSNPIEFMTEAGMSQEEWKAFLANGGTLSPEQKRTRALEKELADTRAQMQQFMKEQDAYRLRQARDMEAAQFVSVMSNYDLVTRMGGIDAVQNKRTFLEQQSKQKVTLKDAAEALEQEYHHGLSALLKDPKVRSKFNLDVNTSDAGPVASKTPRTLNQKVAPSTPPANSGSQKGPPDWAARKAEYLRRTASERSSSAR